ncbi:MAG: mRNA surveillance protein pelota [Methanoculleaceae archaeon]
MKVEYGPMKRSYGEIKFYPETMDDLWHLSHLIHRGDLIFADTFRTVEQAADRIRPEKQEKKPVRLGIRVEKVSFQQNTGRLRVTGVIENGIDIGSYHTVNLDPGREVSVTGYWRPVDLERIERAVRVSEFGMVLILTIEEGEVELFRLRQFGPEQITTLTGGTGKGSDRSTREDLFRQALSLISEGNQMVVVAGPGFVKDDFIAYVKRHDPGTAGRIVPVETRRSGRGAVQEVIGQGVAERLLGDAQLAREVRAMEEVLKRIATGGAVAYGWEDVKNAVEMGAVEEILVSDRCIHHRGVAATIERAETMNSRVTVLSSAFEPGEQLNALGGVAALLRFHIR